jgi:hypothetical protein
MGLLPWVTGTWGDSLPLVALLPGPSQKAIDGNREIEESRLHWPRRLDTLDGVYITRTDVWGNIEAMEVMAHDPAACTRSIGLRTFPCLGSCRMAEGASHAATTLSASHILHCLRTSIILLRGMLLYRITYFLPLRFQSVLLSSYRQLLER